MDPYLIEDSKDTKFVGLLMDKDIATRKHSYVSTAKSPPPTPLGGLSDNNDPNTDTNINIRGELKSEAAELKNVVKKDGTRSVRMQPMNLASLLKEVSTSTNLQNKTGIHDDAKSVSRNESRGGRSQNPFDE